MLILTKKHIVSAIIAVSVLAAGHQSEAAAVLKTDPSVSSGTLDCGLSYYLVDNDSKVGMADFALVRRIEEGLALPSEIGFSRTCLDSLPHFAGRSPLDFMADHGISYPANGTMGCCMGSGRSGLCSTPFFCVDDRTGKTALCR